MRIIIQSHSRYLLRAALILIGLLVIIGSVGVTGATELAIVSNDYPWTNPSPVVASASPVDDIADQYCPGVYQSAEIVGLGSHWICSVAGNGITVGNYFDGYIFRTVVSFRYDTKMYPVYGTGSCEQSGGCLYVAATDTFVTKQNLINGLVRSLVVYKDFTKRLTPQIDKKTDQTIGYSFNLNSPDYTFKSSDNYAWPVGGINASNNGTWLAIEFRERGIGVLNMSTFQMKRIDTTGPRYGTGRDPSIELAITNDGNHVVMMGSNYGGVTLYDTNPPCGDVASDTNMEFVLPIAKPCHRLGVNTDSFIKKMFTSFNPRFDDKGGELDFFAKSYDGKSVAVEMNAANYTPQRLDYLALGDSFSSGEGEVDDSYYVTGTNDPFEKCHLSRRSYPYIIASYLGIESRNAQSVACSGAMIGDIIGNDVSYWGQNNRLDSEHVGLNKISKTIYQASAIDNFNPGRAHQINFVRKYRPKIITVGIGGNDVGFMDKLRSCVGPDTCEWTAYGKAREKTAFEVSSVFNRLVSTYTELHSASPASKIYVIGYPKIIDQSGNCSPLTGMLLNPAEREFMNQGIIYINQVIAAAAKKAGVAYIDTQDSFGSNVLCGDKAPSLMNAVRLGDDDAISDKTNWLKIIGKESFHPRPDGHVALAGTIKNAIPNLLNYNYCAGSSPNNVTACPNKLITVPWPSRYWIDSYQTHQYASQRIDDFASEITETPLPNDQAISFMAATFMPGSTVSVEVHSDPLALGEFTVDSTGAADFTLNLPASLSEGYHTLHVFGTSFSGEAVDIYQVIKYQPPDPEVRADSQLAVKSDKTTDIASSPNKTSDNEMTQQTNHKDIGDNLSPAPKRTGSVLGVSKISDAIDRSPIDITIIKEGQWIIVTLTALSAATLAIIYAIYRHKNK